MHPNTPTARYTCAPTAAGVAATRSATECARSVLAVDSDAAVSGTNSAYSFFFGVRLTSSGSCVPSPRYQAPRKLFQSGRLSVKTERNSVFIWHVNCRKELLFLIPRLLRKRVQHCIYLAEAWIFC
jgi:hypothetical protein